MANGPNDRIKKTKNTYGNPKILNSLDIKIPDKEMHLMHPDEEAPAGGGTCSCHSVCSCVPVSECDCHMVCTCDAVCNSNDCTCNPFTGCQPHNCNCQPDCACTGTCSCTGTICTCVPVTYYYPN